MANRTGWMSKENFESICTNYLFPLLKRKREKDTENAHKRILIILDNHISRMNRSLMETASKQNIDFLTLPAHTSHIIQPLDRGCNGTFKRTFRDEYIVPAEETASSIREAFVRATIIVCLCIYVYIYIYIVVNVYVCV
jgi:hypothetical protein